MVIIDALGPFLRIGSSKGMKGVVTHYQYLPVSCGERALLLEGSRCSWVKDTNKSLIMMICSVPGTKGMLR